MALENAPLAHRMRPATLDEFVGQEHIVGKGTPLRAAIEADVLSSVILAGPPGTGKTTLASVIADATKASFVKLNAVMSGVKDLRQVCTEAEQLFTSMNQKTVLFIDEIHRFNKSQQDALLPYVESGVVILIGATTENPYFEVNSALVSRSHVYLLTPHSKEDLVQILQRSLKDSRGYDDKITLSDEAINHIATISNGDARIALNSLELAIVTIGSDITLEQAQKLFDSRSKRYDKNGEDHYNVVSAFIKTIRGSDVDAALVWLYTMLEAGEQPRFIFRRMAILACEDIGLADPHALQVVISAQQAFEFVGLPEGEFFLSQACIYLAQAPKSNSVYTAMKAASAYVANAPNIEVPNHLRNAPIKEMKQQGYGDGYLYPHSDERGVVSANYFPVGMKKEDFYTPSSRGFEAEVTSRIKKAKDIIKGK